MQEPLENPASDGGPTTRARPRWPRRILLAVLASAALCYAIVLGYHFWVPEPAENADDTLLEQCRTMCLSLGLVPTGHLANDARAYLRSEKPKPLFSPLHEILSDQSFQPQPTQSHPLLGQSAPDFDLPDDQGNRVTLRGTLKDAPVVLVFYYGYHCNHCVGQLFGLKEDLARFTELGTQVVAISADPPELTARRLAEYGRFGFPVLADADNQIAQAYGVYRPEIDGKAETKLHGTFVLDSEGQVLWCQTGNKPFLDNQTLLTVIAAHYDLLN